MKSTLVMIGFIISALIVTEGFSGNKSLAHHKESQIDSLETTLKNHKAILVNTYLLGVTIYNEAFE